MKELSFDEMMDTTGGGCEKAIFGGAIAGSIAGPGGALIGSAGGFFGCMITAWIDCAMK